MHRSGARSQVLTEVGKVLEHPLRPGADELVTAEAAGEHAYHPHSLTLGGLAVPRRVADDERPAAADRCDGDMDQVRRGLGVLDVRTGGHGVDASARVERVERVLRVLRPAGRREHDLDVALGQRVEELPGTLQGQHFVQHCVELALPPLPDLVPVPRFGFVAQQMRDEPVSAHAVRPVDPPEGYVVPGLLERAGPRQHMLVGGVDQRAVHIKDDGVDWLGRGVILNRRHDRAVPRRRRHMCVGKKTAASGAFGSRLPLCSRRKASSTP